MARVNRRRFLEITGASVGALAARPVMAQSPEVVVIGAGAFGGWTALYLREMGLSVTLVDAHGPGNARSSSAGETRQIRASYGDRELYSRWVVDAFERWKTREEEWGKKLFFQTGQITLLREWTDYLQSSKTVLDKLGLDNEVIQRAELIKRFPQFNYDDVELGFYVPSTGILKCREGCLAVAEAFQSKGGRFVMAKAEMGQRSGGKLREVKLSRRDAGGAELRLCVRTVAPKDVSESSRKQATTEPARAVFHGHAPERSSAFLSELPDVHDSRCLWLPRSRRQGSQARPLLGRGTTGPGHRRSHRHAG